MFGGIDATIAYVLFRVSAWLASIYQSQEILMYFPRSWKCAFWQQETQLNFDPGIDWSAVQYLPPKSCYSKKYHLRPSWNNSSSSDTGCLLLKYWCCISPFCLPLEGMLRLSNNIITISKERPETKWNVSMNAPKQLLVKIAWISLGSHGELILDHPFVMPGSNSQK